MYLFSERVFLHYNYFHDYSQNEPTYTLSNLSLLRDFVINQTDSSNHAFLVKYHYDNMVCIFNNFLQKFSHFKNIKSKNISHFDFQRGEYHPGDDTTTSVE